MNDTDSEGSSSLYWGLLRAQGLALLAAGLVVSIFRGPDPILIALWGGLISLFANAWAGFQLWMHPGNRGSSRRASAAIRAEVGKVAIVLVLFGLTLKQWPDVHTGSNAVILVLAFLWTYVAGLFWLHRATTADANEHHDENS